MELQHASEGRYIIDFKELKVGDYSFEFHVGASLFAPYEGCEVLDGDCKVAVEMSRSESMLNLQVAISGSVDVECDRCLEPCAVAIDYDETLIIKFSDNEELMDEYDGDIMWLPTSSASVDLAHYIYESIILSLPYQRVHPEGECNAEMVARFTTIEPSEEEQMADVAEEDNVSLPSEQLTKLMALKEKMTKE